jgi:hypothetical protein
MICIINVPVSTIPRLPRARAYLMFSLIFGDSSVSEDQKIRNHIYLTVKLACTA